MAASRVLIGVGLVLLFSATVMTQAGPPHSSMADALDAFEQGEWADGIAPALDPAALQQTLKTLKESAQLWVMARGPSEESRRRLAVGTFVLQLLRSQDDPYLWMGGVATPVARGSRGGGYVWPRPAVEMLEWACSFLRGARPLPAERWWHVAANALLERHGASQMLMLHLDHAHGRFPADDRWVLSRAVAEELRTWPEPRDDRAFLFPTTMASSLVGRYAEALERGSVRAEAAIRLGYFELRRNHVDAAIARFDQAGTPADPALTYWLGLFRGQALAQRSRHDEAIASYQDALRAFPDAQSAVLSLASTLVAVHRDGEAADLVGKSVSRRPAAEDPWAEYVSPDWRFWAQANAELRQATRR